MAGWGARRAALGLLATLGCSSSTSVTGDAPEVVALKTEYEARLARQQRRLDRTKAEVDACRARSEVRADQDRHRIERLERALARQRRPLGRRRADGSGARTSKQDALARVAEGAQIATRADRLVLMIPAARLFEEGGAQITADGEAVVARLAELLLGEDTRVTVVGHADPALAAALAWRTSAARARAVVERLQGLGVDPSRLSLEARAGYAPTAAVRGARLEVIVPAPGALDGNRRRRE